MNKKEVIELFGEINIELTDLNINLLEKYYKILIEKNNEFNLTRITEKKEVYIKHFYDSILSIKGLNLETQKIIDIGSGAGFPGIVIKILFPETKITLLDSTSKKVAFLNYVIKELDLKKIEAISARAEEYQINVRETFDIAIARAVAPLNILLELSVPFIKQDGIFVAMKGIKGKNELENSKKSLKELNIKVWEINNYILPYEMGERVVFSFKKLGKLNIKYPRKYSQILKKPL